MPKSFHGSCWLTCSKYSSGWGHLEVATCRSQKNTLMFKEVSEISPIILNLSVRNLSCEISVFKFHQAALQFYNTQKRHELAESGLALNYVICSRTPKHYQIMNAALEPLRGIIKSCLFIAFGFKFQLCLSLQKFCYAWEKQKTCFTKAVLLG